MKEEGHVRKYLTIAILANKAEAVVTESFKSILPVIENLEVLVINDGAIPRIEEITQEYIARFPKHIRLLNKESGCIGSAINLALRNAGTAWFKLLQAGDILLEEGLRDLLSVIRELEASEIHTEMIVSDFLYEVREKNGDGKCVASQYRVDYSNVFLQRGLTSWSRIKNFDVDQLLGEQAITYSIDLIHKINLRLPEHLQHAEHIYVYEPLPHVRRIYYLDEPLYVSYIGQDRQEYNMKKLEENVKDLIAVSLEIFRRIRVDSVRPQRLQRYMYHHLSRLISVAMMPLGIQQIGKSEALAQMELLWAEFEKINAKAAKKLRKIPLLNPTRILKAANSYLDKNVYNLISKVFILGY